MVSGGCADAVDRAARLDLAVAASGCPMAWAFRCGVVGRCPEWGGRRGLHVVADLGLPRLDPVPVGGVGAATWVRVAHQLVICP